MLRSALVLLVVAAVAGIACGEDYGESSSASSASSSSSSGSPDSGRPSPGSTDAGLVSTPGKIECGDKTCDIATTTCCFENNNSGYACVPKGEQCKSNAAVCDEAADCETGKSCCGTIGFGKFEAVCQPSCNVSQVCRTNAECGSEGCIKQRCTGYVSWLCGKNPFCDAL